MKNEKFFQQLLMVDMGMEGKLSSRAIEWKQNHSDPMVESHENSLESHGPLTAFFSTVDDRSTSAFTSTGVYQSTSSSDAELARARFRRWEEFEQREVVGGQLEEKRKKKKKKEEKKKEGNAREENVLPNRKLRRSQL